MTTTLTTPHTTSTNTTTRNPVAYTTMHPLPSYHTPTAQPTPETLAQAFNAIEPALRGAIIKDITAGVLRARGQKLFSEVIAGMEAAITALTEDLAPAPDTTPLNLTTHLTTLGVAPSEAPVALAHANTETRTRCAKIIATRRTTRPGAEGAFFNMGIEMAISITTGA